MTKYSKFPIEYERVPVQYGNLSKTPRNCYRLGMEKRMEENLEHCYKYYRICEGQISGGRFFYRDDWWDKENRYTIINYCSYEDLPESIRKSIEG